MSKRKLTIEALAKLQPHLAKHRTLLLNADYQPVQYAPLSLVPWTKVVWWLVKGDVTGLPRITVVEEYEDVVINGVNKSYALPSVVAYTNYVKFPEIINFSRYNVFLRDGFKCQYTGEKLMPEHLTIDHVVPLEKGGKTTWDNIVTATPKINHLKTNLSLKDFKKRYGYQLKRDPYTPTYHELREKGKSHPPKIIHPSWEKYIK